MPEPPRSRPRLVGLDAWRQTREQLRRVFAEAGLSEEVWREGAELQAAVQNAVADSQRMSAGVPGVGLDLVLPDFEARKASLGRNVGEQRIALVQARLARA